jgi:hypothetical protein
MRKFIILALVVVLAVMLFLPNLLFASNGVYTYDVTVSKTASGFDSGEFTFDLYVYNDHPSTLEWELRDTETISYVGGSVTFNMASSSSSLDIRVVESGTNGATGVANNICSPPTAIDGDICNTTSDFTLSGNTTRTVYFDNIKITKSKPLSESEEEGWVRDREMKCFQVWINEDNNFEFVFWWVYANNNHVQIYDMAGNLVWETDFEKDEPHFEVNLPDGMYTVKTFHEAGHILQEFVIGKP